MKRILVRYRARPERAEENARLIEKVFEELRAKAPDGVRYLSLRLDDGTFIHFAETAEGATPIPALEAFRSFQAGIKERCLEPPLSAEATIIGNYRMLAE
jgi:radical SAM superfamily enzyme with C-terminal helix-hairpin-helix motif